jgi:hypothetical protein
LIWPAAGRADPGSLFAAVELAIAMAKGQHEHPPAPAARRRMPCWAWRPAPTCSRKSPSPLLPRVARKPRIALALGGGAARGFAHIGVIKALETQRDHA